MDEEPPLQYMESDPKVANGSIAKLSLGGGRYIVSMPVIAGGEVAEVVMKRAGRFKQVARNLQVKDVVVGDGERRRRFVLCHNPDESARQRAHRDRVLRELEAELESLKSCSGERHSKRACRLVASRRHRVVQGSQRCRVHVRPVQAGSPVRHPLREDLAQLHGSRFAVLHQVLAEDLSGLWCYKGLC